MTHLLEEESFQAPPPELCVCPNKTNEPSCSPDNITQQQNTLITHLQGDIFGKYATQKAKIWASISTIFQVPWKPCSCFGLLGVHCKKYPDYFFCSNCEYADDME